MYLLPILALCSCRPEENPDLGTAVIGIYEGSVTRYLGTDSAFDIDNQRIEVEAIDETHARILPLSYPDASPADTIPLTALLTATPYSFITTDGVMLTIDPVSYTEGKIEGVPYSISIGGDPEEHGVYETQSGRLFYTIEIIRDGVPEYELFEGWRQ